MSKVDNQGRKENVSNQEHGSLEWVNPKSIIDSNTNPRRIVDIAELVESVRSVGIIEPLIVRRVNDFRPMMTVLVCGARRLAAAKAAGLSEIPVYVRDLTESEGLELQIIENRDRQDVHPMDEAYAYQQLLSAPLPDGSERTVENVAERCGVAIGRLHRSLGLLKLCESVQALFRDDKITSKVAQLISTLKPSEQASAADHVADKDGLGALPYPLVVKYIQETFLLDLANAPFDVSSSEFSAPPCAECPKRSGSQPDLFGGFDGLELCSDPACYSRKGKLSWKKVSGAAKQGGQAVLSDKAAAEIFRFGATEVPDTSSYVSVESVCPQDPARRSYLQVLGDQAPETVLARDGRGGVHRLIDREQAGIVIARMLPPEIVAETAKIETAKEEEKKADEATVQARKEFNALYDATRTNMHARRNELPVRLIAQTFLGQARKTRAAYGITAKNLAIFLADKNTAELCEIIMDSILEIYAVDLESLVEIGWPYLPDDSKSTKKAVKKKASKK